MYPKLTILALFVLLTGLTSFAAEPGNKSAPFTQSAPVFTSSAPSDPHLAGKEFTYSFSATDDDLDPISFFMTGEVQSGPNYQPETYWSTGQQNSIWQSFTADSTGFLTSAGILCSSSNIEIDTVCIYSGTGTGGSVLYKAPFQMDYYYDYHSVTIPVSAGVLLNSGSTYTIEFKSVSGLIVTYMEYDYLGNPYPGGRGSFSELSDHPFVTSIKPLKTFPNAAWLTLTDNGNGSGSLVGTPPESAIGTFSEILIAKAGSDYTQQQISFEITNPVQPPTGLFAITGDGQIELKWMKNSSAEFGKYYLYGGAEPHPTNLIDSSSSVSDTTKIITGLNNGTLYYFRVKAKSSGNILSGFSNEDAAVPVSNEGNALLLDGYSQYVVLPSNSFYQNKSFTMEVWAKRNSTYSGDWIFGQGFTYTDYGLHIGFREGNGFSFALYADDLEQGQPNFSQDWQHLALTYEAGTREQKMYIDGVLVNSRLSNDVYWGYGEFYIGRTAWNMDDAFDGSLDEVRLWNYVRSESEINDNRILTLRGDEPGLIGLYHFDEPSGTVVYDASPNGINGTIIGGASFVGSDAFTSGTLPVELSSFSGQFLNGKVILTWSTASEKNNAGWEIQRQEDRSQKSGDRSQKSGDRINANWETIGFVAGKGTTTETQSYSFTSLVPSRSSGTGSPSSPAVYRLKQLDLDGTVSFSQILTLDIAPTAFSLEKNYPNPFNPTTTIRYQLPAQTQVTLSVFDVTGRLISVLENGLKPAGFHQVVFNAAGLSSGIYYYIIKAGNENKTGKMLLAK